MTVNLRAGLLALALSALAGAAAARDYIVVASTDPAIARGQAYDSGAKVALAPGRTLTLMHASGDLVRLKGLAGGVLLPRRAASQVDAERLALLKSMVSTDQGQPGAARPSRNRGGVCPASSNIVTLDAMVQVHQAGCPAEAAEALEAWLASHPPTDEPGS